MRGGQLLTLLLSRLSRKALCTPSAAGLSDIFFLPGSQLWRFPHRDFLRTPLRAFERHIMA